jgi:hypothetical protein
MCLEVRRRVLLARSDHGCGGINGVRPAPTRAGLLRRVLLPMDRVAAIETANSRSTIPPCESRTAAQPECGE